MPILTTGPNFLVRTDVRTDGRTGGRTDPNCRKTLFLKIFHAMIMEQNKDDNIQNYRVATFLHIVHICIRNHYAEFEINMTIL